ncbi:MAG: Na+/proline symporter, partial [Pseudohongiellaceae bacterium]
SAILYEIIPGFIVCLLVSVAVSVMGKPVQASVLHRHQEFTRLLEHK